MTAAERAGAFESLLRRFVLGEQSEVSEEHALVVEKVLGISPGRRQRVEGSGPWLTGPAKDLFDAVPIALPQLAQAVAQATDGELESARTLAAALFRNLPIAARLIGAATGDENRAGLHNIARLDQEPEIAVLLVPTVVAMLQAGWQENLEALAAALRPFPGMIADLDKVLDMSAKEVQGNLASQPPNIRVRAQKMIDAALEGRLN
ncbi:MULTISPECIES: hypothetical protein [unclassified Kitasatospora]|uniref:hypothetical protein n=1 Tax=unclassified Kitasatospora TaxID=2633591 RepID=UPI002475E385|nr:hypothetical protein [Kitasatospora sp. MAP12-44]